MNEGNNSEGGERRDIKNNPAYRELAEKVSEETVNRVFTAVGVNITTPENRIEVQRDFTHLRRHREAQEQIGKTARRVLVTAFIAGALGALWLGFKQEIAALLK